MFQRLFISFVFLSIALSAFSQVQPLSRKDSGEVLSYIEKYEEMAKSNDKEASRYLNKIAFIYWNHNQYQKAIDYYQESLALNKNVSNENGIAMLNGNLGVLYSDIGNYQESLKYFERTLAARKSMGEPISLISALTNISVVLNNLGRYDESIKHLEDALTYAKELNDPKEIMSCYAQISETYEKAGNPDKSFDYFELYRLLYDKIQKEEITVFEEKLEEETIKKKLVEAEKTEKENELLRKQLEIQTKDQALTASDSINKNLNKDLSLTSEELKLKKVEAQLANEQVENQKRKRNLLLVAFVLLAVIALLILFTYRRARKLNALLQEKNRSIEKQKRQLEDANLIKDKLFSIVAHDLRSPFASLISFFYILDDSKLPEDVRVIFEELKQHVNSTSDLLDNLLYWAKSQIQGFEPQFNSISINSLVNENIDLLKPMAETKGIKLYSLLTEELVASGDLEMIKLVIRNFVQNAIKFTPTNGEIKIIGQAIEDKIHLQVEDSGLGMSEKKIQSLFELHSNKSTSGTNDEKGTGLGLVLCNEFILKNNGELTVESTVGEGTRMGFIIDAA